ncbi:MAG: HTTM domain-containing protein, partial [Flavobacteriales bacterium]
MKSINDILFSPKKYYTLVFFRVIFGIVTLVSSVRFLLKGWVNELFLEPSFHFKYYGFDWIKELGIVEMYSLFGLMIVCSIFIAIGFLYRFAIVLFFLLFSYFELIDLTNYLNHYYFVSLMAFVLVFLPANCNFSLDAKFQLVWTIGIIVLQLSIVYFYAGIAKLNYDWLIEANPLKIWLAPHSNLPIIGQYMDQPITAYLFSWGGAIFDLSVPFLLLFKKTRWIGYTLV